MQLISKPKEYSFNEKHGFESFYSFRLVLTERSWFGPKYVSKEDCSWFIDQLREQVGMFTEMFGKRNEKSPTYHFIIDTSVFAEELPQNVALIEFLEELNDFSEIDQNDIEMVKSSKKYLKKLRNYANNVENYSYLFRWAHINPDHPFSKEVYDIILKGINQIAVKMERYIEKHTFSQFKRIKQIMDKNGMTTEEAFESEEFLKDRTEFLYNFSEMEGKFVKKLLKYGIDEPNVFFYANYLLIKYEEFFETEQKARTKQLFNGRHYEAPKQSNYVLIEREKNNIKLYLRQFDMTEETDYSLIEQQSFIHNIFMGDITKSEESLYALSYVSDEEDLEKIEVLKTIVNWVASKIPYEKQDVLPKAKWLHFLPFELYEEFGIAGLTFEGIRTVGGVNGRELLVQTKCVMGFGDYKEILFPILDTNSWDELNLRQCFLIAYATCLYHDICIEGKYKMHESSQRLPDNSPFYILDVGNTLLDGGVLKSNKNYPSKKVTNSNSQHKQTKEEHWVSFHFRKLKDSWSASEDAKNNAKKYGIKELPKGYTFVDAHVKGENKENKPNISAVDVIGKTLSKMIAVKSEQ